MIDEEQVKTIVKKVLDEEHLTGFIKIFEKEHNLFRGSHDKIQLPEHVNIPDTIVNQIVEKFDTQLTEGSIPFIDEDSHFTENKDELFYDETKKILCLGLNSPETDMVGGYCMKEGTAPTQNIVGTVQAYVLDTPTERLTDGALEEWSGPTNLLWWTEYDAWGDVEREGTVVHGGTYSCKLTTPSGGNWCWIEQGLILSPGLNCKISIWYIRTAHAGSNLRLYLYDSAINVYLQPDGTWGTDIAVHYLPAAEDWTLYELEFVSHPDYLDYVIKVYKDHSSGGAVSFYVDDISVAEIGNTIPYFRTSTGIVIGLDQDLRKVTDPIFAGLALTDFSGVLKAVDGVVNGGAAHADLAEISSDQHHDQLHAESHHSEAEDAIKLDDLDSPEDNTDLNASLTAHGLLMKLGGGTTNFLRADGAWAAPPGGNGATTFVGLTDTPADYTDQAGKFCKVKAGEDGLEFAVGAGNGGGYGKEVIDEIFDSLADGNIHGKGAYAGWAAWNTDVEDADCSAQIVANPGNGKMLRLSDANTNGLVNTRLDSDPGCEIVQCLFKCKMRISTLADTNNRAYIGVWDKNGTHTGIYFRDNFLKWYTGSASVDLVAAVADTWYSVEVFMDCTAGKAVIWVDGVLKLTSQPCLTQDIESFTFYTKLLSPVGGYTFDIDDFFIVDLTRKQ